ncbi:MAG: AbrB/MazE/SpoVT family DNA-binding domain-containing protein [Gemmatimonadota bacterium]
MRLVTVSRGYRITIPRDVRERLGIEPGQRLQVVDYRERIELLPLRSPGELRGFLRGTTSSFERGPDRM